MSNDFLSPTVVNMMFLDSFQRFCFVCKFDDRAQALEESWERAWEKEWNVKKGKGVFSQTFQNLWKDDNAMKIPQLILNSTVVETG